MLNKRQVSSLLSVSSRFDRRADDDDATVITGEGEI